VIREAIIGTPYPGALPTRVAEEVTDVIEDAMQQPKEVTSVSGMGMSRLKAEIDPPFARTRDALEQLWDKLRRKVEDARRQLPPGAGPSLVNDELDDFYALFFAITGDGYSLGAEPRLRGCAGAGAGAGARRGSRGDPRRGAPSPCRTF
jgi:multidrug efflux pump subunit AcrB